jgi:hypothetical protein
MTPEPTVATELEDRKAKRAEIAAYFKARPLAEVEPEELLKISVNYHQRISECRRELGMTLQNRRRTRTDDAGAVHRLPGAYRWLPTGEPLGRDSGTVIAAGWSTKHSRPFEEPFTLTAPKP